MDLFRSRKRGTDIAGFETGGQLGKQHRDRVGGSMDDLLDRHDGDILVPEDSSSDSGDDENVKVSRQHKTFAKKSIKREKKKEKDLKEKLEKNNISMDDFLGKQSEFKMWLYKEKGKNAGSMGSPKLKSHFKTFVRLWNKRKLAPEYYRGSTLPGSPAPLTPRKCNFLSEVPVSGDVSPLKPDGDVERLERSAPPSPFVTFGKTPPKVFRTKKFQLFGSGKDVALISVAPLGSPQVKVKSKCPDSDEYAVPTTEPTATSADNHSFSHDTSVLYARPSQVLKGLPSKDMQTSSTREAGDNDQWPPPPPPCVFTDKASYSVPSDFMWGDNSSLSSDSTKGGNALPSPPGEFKGSNSLSYPSPPTKLKGSNTPGTCEVRGDNLVSSSDSPHVPPPPPPRLESLQNMAASPRLHQNYADPYDTLPAPPGDLLDSSMNHDYQDPIDLIPELKHSPSRKHSENTKNSHFNSGDVNSTAEHSNATSEGSCLTKDEIKRLYAIPLKKARQHAVIVDSDIEMKSENEPEKSEAAESELFTEIMDHIKREKSTEKEPMEGVAKRFRPDPIYDTIDDCLIGLKSDDSESQKVEQDLSSNAGHYKKNAPKFASLSRSTKVMAASTEKIYETYLSHRKGGNTEWRKQGLKSMEIQPPVVANPQKQRSKSQSDVNFDTELKLPTVKSDKLDNGNEKLEFSRSESHNKKDSGDKNDSHGTKKQERKVVETAV